MHIAQVYRYTHDVVHLQEVKACYKYTMTICVHTS